MANSLTALQALERARQAQERHERRIDVQTRIPLEVTPSGASEICPVCGTVYDLHFNVGYVPPYGDGCDNCSPSDEEFNEFWS